MSEYANNKRIAKNTLFLYLRTLIILVITLYTSRVVLSVLGVEDYGIYIVVGGVVAMFSAISGALSSAISRFITFELGKGDTAKLKKVFSTSVNIQILISLLVIIVGEIAGVWFLNNKMSIPSERMGAANWVLQCSLLTFCVNLVSVPYNACIIAHEKMKAFAYVSVLEALLKLSVCYMIIVSQWDKLISYSVLLLCVAISIRMTYSIYCHRHFEESHYHYVSDRQLMKEMAGFAGWNFYTNGAYIFNTQGINLLINIYFGVTLNAARGIANQVDHAVMQLVNSFTTALNPQITKNYASGNMESMYLLVCRGARFSYFLLLVFALPIFVETEYILSVWLKLVPPHAVNFVRLSIVASLVHILGKSGYTASMATGNIRRYVFWVASVGCLAFPLTWIAFAAGAPSESAYWVFIIVYIFVEAVRLWIMKGLLDFPIPMFINDVLIKISIVTASAVSIPLIIVWQMDPSFIRCVISISFSVLSAALCIWLFGLTSGEKSLISDYLKKRLRR